MAKTVLILKSKLDGTEITIHQSALYPEASAAPSYSSRCLTHYPRGLVCTEVSVFPIYFDSSFPGITFSLEILMSSHCLKFALLASWKKQELFHMPGLFLKDWKQQVMVEVEPW